MSSKMPSSKAKVGDTILVNTYEGRSSTAKKNAGKMLKVTAVCGGYVNTDYTYCLGIWNDEYELVTESPKAESELERLVRVANDGYKAVERLNAECTLTVQYRSDLDDETQWALLNDYYRTHRTPATGRQYRVKPTPAFEPFYVGPSDTSYSGPDAHAGKWLVKLEGDTLHVGCKKFKAAEVKYVLDGFCGEGGTIKSDYLGEEVWATRSGLGSRNGKITWADADRILAALEKAGV